MNICIRVFKISAYIGLIILAGCSKKHQKALHSPNKKIQLKFSLDKGIPKYQVSYQGKKFILPSKLGIKFKNQAPLDSNFTIAGIDRDSKNTTWSPPYGTADTIRNHYHEMTVRLKNHETGGKLNLIFRAYNDGVAFRYQIPKQQNKDSLLITGEKTSFRFAKNYSNFALLRTGFNGNYEGQYLKQSLNDIPADTLVAMPLLLHLNNGWAALVEADLHDYPDMSLTKGSNRKNELVGALAPFKKNSFLKAKVKAPFKSPWRTIMLGKRAGDLIPSNLVLNLSEPNKISDTSFIKPGQAIWPWWNGRIADHLKRSGEPSTDVMKYYIDFAAKHHIPALMVDAGWYSTEHDAWAIPEKLDPLTMVSSRKSYYDIHDVINYGKKKGVDIYVWILDVTLEKNPKKILSTYAKWGVKGIKVDSPGGDDQGHVAIIHKIARIAAKNKLMMDFHGAFIPTGYKRTYPNLMTREGVFGLEQSRWSHKPKATHNVTIPYTRMLTGPMDYTPGAFDLDGTKEHPKHVQTTRAQQVAMYIVYYSPWQMLPDYPGIYKKYPKQFQFVLDIPTDWDETKFVAGKPAQYIVLARRKGNTWYLGAMTNESSRKVNISLHFLKKNQKYKARILKDASDAETTPQHVVMDNKTITSSESLHLKLAKSGGAAIILSPY